MRYSQLVLHFFACTHQLFFDDFVVVQAGDEHEVLSLILAPYLSLSDSFIALRVKIWRHSPCITFVGSVRPVV